MKSGVTIHSQIAERGGPGIRLWYYCRSVDTKGSSWVRIRMEDAARALSRAESTLWRWLRQHSPEQRRRKSVHAVYFRRFKIWEDGTVSINMCARDMVARSLGLEKLGHAGVVESSDLKRPIKEVATEITIAALQKSALHLCHKQIREQPLTLEGFKRVFREIPIGKLLELVEQGSEVWRGRFDTTIPGTELWAYPWESRSDIRGTLLYREDSRVNAPYGVSQARVGQELGRSREAIRRRCRNLARFHQYQQVNMDLDEIGFYRSEGELVPGYYKKMAGMIIRVFPNLYDISHIRLHSIKRARYEYNKALELSKLYLLEAEAVGTDSSTTTSTVIPRVTPKVILKKDRAEAGSAA